jgi:segregation and condensation protein B
MDREDYPAMVGAGEATATACVSAEPSGESVPRDEHPSPDPQDAAALSERAEIEPAEREVEEAAPTGPTPGQVIEALLFASDAPVPGSRLAQLAELKSAREVRAHVEALNERYAEFGLTFRIEEIAKGYRMLSRPEYQAYIAQMSDEQAQTRLTGAALETLSIVAYKQPVIRADVEAIRGVSCGEVLNRLREMGLVRIIGRADILGRPMLYGTTRKFLDVFGLADLDDLPPMEALELKRAEKRVEDVPQAPAEAHPEHPPVAAAGA